MLKKLMKCSDQHTLRHFGSMTACMYCLYSLVTGLSQTNQSECVRGIFLVPFSISNFIILFQNLTLKKCRLYNVFGSGASHGIHAQFMIQASHRTMEKGLDYFEELELGFRFATWFYAIYGLLSQKHALYATVHNPTFQTLAHNTRVALAVQDIENSQFWRDIHCLKRAVLWDTVMQFFLPWIRLIILSKG